jgi:uncharacterized protein (TIGR03663 family)
VSTSSTKSRGSKVNPKRRVEPQAARAPEVVAMNDLPERVWQIGVVVILVVAAVLRVYDLNLVPLHHDEGVNGNFLVRLVREGAYQYDPGNYHGPTLYYFTAIVGWTIRLLFGANAADAYGLNTVTIRLVTVFFGLATIGLIFALRRRLGTVATLVAALLLAISPGAVYLSRYYIHESLFVFFTLGIVVACLRFYDDRNLIYLLLASISAALLFATKETAMISAAVLIIAFGVMHSHRFLLGRLLLNKRDKEVKGESFDDFLSSIGGLSGLAIGVSLALALFVGVYVLFYSSFFKNFPKGIYDSLKTFEIWTKTGTEAHVHPFATYLYWLKSQESALLFLGVIGAAFTVLKPRNSFALFTALWSFGLIAAYSLVPYKTPWLALNFIVPLALIAGYAVQAIWEMDSTQLRLPVLVLIVALSIGVYQSIDLNFFNYDNDNPKYVYVYAHTKRPMLQLVKELEKLASRSGGAQAGITIVSPDYWPLPWYLRDYKRVGYYARMTPTTEPIIIASETQRNEIATQFGDLYQQVPSTESGGGFELRPGVKLLLYSRRIPVAQPPPAIK